MLTACASAPVAFGGLHQWQTSLLLLWAGMQPHHGCPSHPACRLTHVSPVWYQLRSSSGVLTLTGGHDVDAGWMAAVRQPCGQQVRSWCAWCKLAVDETIVLLPSKCICAAHISNSQCCLFNEDVPSPFPAAAGPQANHTARILPRVIFELQGQVRHAYLQG